MKIVVSVLSSTDRDLSDQMLLLPKLFPFGDRPGPKGQVIDGHLAAARLANRVLLSKVVFLLFLLILAGWRITGERLWGMSRRQKNKESHYDSPYHQGASTYHIITCLGCGV